VRERSSVAIDVASTVVLVLVGAVWLVPYAWMTVTSLKTLPEIVQAPAS